MGTKCRAGGSTIRPLQPTLANYRAICSIVEACASIGLEAELCTFCRRMHLRQLNLCQCLPTRLSQSAAFALAVFNNLDIRVVRTEDCLSIPSTRQTLAVRLLKVAARMAWLGDFTSGLEKRPRKLREKKEPESVDRARARGCKRVCSATKLEPAKCRGGSPVPYWL